jgi:hypothetical protein
LVGHAGNRHLRAFDKSDDRSDFHGLGRSRESISAFGSAPGLNESGPPQLVQDNLEKPHRDSLRFRDVADFDGTLALPFCELKNGPDRVLALL